MMEPDAAPARVLSAKHAPGRRRGSARWPIGAACQELADAWPFQKMEAASEKRGPVP